MITLFECTFLEHFHTEEAKLSLCEKKSNFLNFQNKILSLSSTYLISKAQDFPSVCSPECLYSGLSAEFNSSLVLVYCTIFEDGICNMH